MNQLMQDMPLTIFGDGSQTRAFSYIGDVAPYIAESVNIPAAYNQVFNIGADQDFSVNDLAGTVCEVLGVKGQIRHVEARNEVLHAYADHTKVQRIFDINTHYTLKEGLQKMADWAKTSGIRRSTKFSGIEITEKLPPVWLED